VLRGGGFAFAESFGESGGEEERESRGFDWDVDGDDSGGGKAEEPVETQKKEARKVKAEMKAKNWGVDMTAVEPIEANFKSRRCRRRKCSVADDAE
jgi:hypothetical protein